MPAVQRLDPKHYRRLPWKNGRGELVLIDGDGHGTWEDRGVAWHFGRTPIVEEGPFSDYSGYERLQVVIKGTGLVLVAPDHEIDLRRTFEPRRYDGGTPIRTRLENGPVEVVNLIADRARFRTELGVGRPGTALECRPGRHVVHAPADDAEVMVGDHHYALPLDTALSVNTSEPVVVRILAGIILVGSIYGATTA